MSTTILAIDLGKFNSVLCWYEPATRGSNHLSAGGAEPRGGGAPGGRRLGTVHHRHPRPGAHPRPGYGTWRARDRRFGTR